MKTAALRTTLLWLLVLACFSSPLAQTFPDLGEDFSDSENINSTDTASKRKLRIARFRTIQQLMTQHVEAAQLKNAQGNLARSQMKIDEALEGFLRTDFMEQYKKIKVEAEVLAATFKTLSNQLSPKEVGKIRIAYTGVAHAFNEQLLSIRDDFMDNKKLKFIRKHPKYYSLELQHELEALKEAYSQDFEKAVVEVTGSDLYAGAPLAAAIFGLIRLAVDLTDYISTIKWEARRIKKEHLERFLIGPYSFKRWEEITVNNFGYFDQGFNQMPGEFQDSSEELDPSYPFQEDELPNSAPPRRKNN